jgi:CheY-like chemotaxis protein
METLPGENPLLRAGRQLPLLADKVRLHILELGLEQELSEPAEVVTRRSHWPQRNHAPPSPKAENLTRGRDVYHYRIMPYGKAEPARQAREPLASELLRGSLPGSTHFTSDAQTSKEALMSEKILLVDDDEVLGQVLRRVLSQDGYTVLPAASVSQALQVDQEHDPRLGLVDLCLPDGDGVQLADALRAQHPGLPLILMTAYPVRLRDNAVGAERFVRVLTKPLNVKELRQTIATSLLAANGTAVSAAPVSQPISLPPEVPASSFFRD